MGENDDDDFGLPELPCPYASWHDKKKLLVDCGKDFSKKGKLYTIPFEACKRCYLRKLHIRQKKGEKQSILPQTYYCTLKDETHRLNSPADLQKLYCVKDPMYICPNTKCHQQVMKLLREFNVSIPQKQKGGM